MEKEIILTSAYLAPVEYYVKLFAYDKIYVEGEDHYVKQTYRNRCVIASAGGELALTVPTEKEELDKVRMRDIRISDHGNWRHVHWNALVAAYKQSPFFDYYADELAHFYEHKYEFLFDFNWDLCEWVCRQMDLEVQMCITEEYVPEWQGVDDFRELIHPKKDFRVADPDFSPKPYYQVFELKHGFLPNLSIVDLLFNMGPESILVLRDGVVKSKR